MNVVEQNQHYRVRALSVYSVCSFNCLTLYDVQYDISIIYMYEKRSKKKKPTNIIKSPDFSFSYLNENLSQIYFWDCLCYKSHACVLYMFNDPNHYHNQLLHSISLAINLFWKVSKRLNCEYLLFSNSKNSKRKIHKLISFLIHL